MDIPKTIVILKSLAPLIEIVPLAGNGLAAMIGVAVQVCEFAQGAQANRDELRELAQGIAGYAIAISQAVQSDPSYSSVASSSKDNPDQQQTWRNEIDKLTSLFGEVLTITNERQERDNNSRGRAARTVNRISQEILNKRDDEKKNIQRLRKKVEECVQAFHIGTEIRGLNELEKLRKKMEETTVRQVQEHNTIMDRIRAQREDLQDVKFHQQLGTSLLCCIFIFTDLHSNTCSSASSSQSNVPNSMRAECQTAASSVPENRS